MSGTADSIGCKKMGKKWLIWVVAAGAAASIAGCAQLGYYAQAAHGQVSLLSAARPIDDWLDNPSVEQDLKGRLVKVKEIRAFAVGELGLPENGSYTTYASLGRPFVMWNVVATPELSLKPKKWCFPVAGCVSYRGYYSQQDALAYAERLRTERYDVEVAGVPAYSTLGWFKDPVLSTFIQYPDARLARLVFHELAHQQLYVKGDTQFNESFAVAVEEIGVERWLVRHGNDEMRQSYAAYQGRKQDFLSLLMTHRRLLEANYERDTSDQEKRREKAAIFAALQEEYQGLKQVWGGYAGYDRWFEQPLSNARLSAIAAYHDLVPGFRALLAQHESLDAFYAAVRALSGLSKEERNLQLLTLGEQPAMARSPVSSAAVPN
jgi:predicted aminopeptidase